MPMSRLRARTLRFGDMTMERRPSSRPGGRVSGLAAALVASAALVVPAAIAPAPAAEAAPDDIIAIVLDGTGNGHGRGLSQWGAYGYAVDHGWDWQQILDHYYGGTISGTTSAGQRIDVRLTDYDGMGDVGVISHGSGVRWNGQTAPAMRADETTPGVFDIYKANTIACPSSTSLTVPDGPVVQQSGYNSDAERVQRFLRAFHDTGIAVDGYFGPQTASILADWQADRGITVNGSRWNADDATAARAQIAASGGSVSWTKIGTHTQSAGESRPVHLGRRRRHGNRSRRRPRCVLLRRCHHALSRRDRSRAHLQRQPGRQRRARRELRPRRDPQGDLGELGLCR